MVIGWLGRETIHMQGVQNVKKYGKAGGGMMYPKQKQHKAARLKCFKCGAELTPATAYHYVDSCNCAITNNAPPHCRDCYIATYGRW